VKIKEKKKKEKIANTKLKVGTPQVPPRNEGVVEKFQTPP
jgi:hypothetical protein